MTTEEFQKVVSNRIAEITRVLGSKAEEYSGYDDRLRSLKQGALLAGQTPTEYLWSLACKHLECIRELANGRLDRKYADEKICDAINYLILLECLLEDSAD